MTALDRYLVQSDFEAALESVFRVAVQDSVVDLTLVEVRPNPSASPDWEMFSLLFEAPGATPFAHDTYTVTHHSLGEFALFVGAVQTAAGEVLYESVFNHPKRDPRLRET